jgi:splicing factor 1
LETTRYELIQEALATIPDYNPPLDYRPPTKFTDKLHIPIDEYPDINFLGQLFGARGRSIQALKDHSGANISVRGRGAVKPGKNKSQDCFATSTEPLHCLIIADSADKLRKAQDLVQSVIDNAIATCGGYNARKTQQLRDLAIMNGTFRDDENHVAPIHTTIEQPTRLLESHSTKHREIEDFDFNREYDLLLEDIGANQHVEMRAKVPPWRLNRFSREK